MPLSYPDAVTWARRQQASATPRLGSLESYAFAKHPEVFGLFGTEGAQLAAQANRPQKRFRDDPAFAVWLPVMASAVAAMFGVFAFFTEPDTPFSARGIPPTLAIPYAIVLFSVSAATLVLLWFGWLHTRASWSWPIVGFTAVDIILCGIGLFAAAHRSAQDVHSGDLVPVWITVVLAASLLVAQFVRIRNKTPPRPVRSGAPATAASASLTVADRQRAIAAAGALPAAEQTAIRADRDAALRILHERGVLTDDALDRALRTELGGLFVLDPRA